MTMPDQQMQLSDAVLNRLYRYAYSLVMQPDDAYDLVHQAVETALRSPPKDRKQEEGYLRRIIRSRFIDEWRRKRKLSFEVFSEQDHCDDGAELEVLTIDGKTLERLLQQLSPLQRETLYFWAVEGYTAAQIAEITDEPRGTILARLSRIRQQLQRQAVRTG